MPHKEHPRWRGRVDAQALFIACGGIVATAVLSLCAFTFCPHTTAQGIVAVGTLILCVLAGASASVMFRRISNPSYQEFCNTDGLTGLKNRYAFEVDLMNLQARRKGLQVGILLFDLNNLKQVNDRLGHCAGDDYLRLAAQAVRSGAGQGALCYRVGGDELATLVLGGGEETMRGLLARTVASFEQMCPAWAVPMSLAAGWACYRPDRDKSLWDVYARADQQMYANKRMQAAGGQR